jgi:hypothetical protein
MLEPCENERHMRFLGKLSGWIVCPPAGKKNGQIHCICIHGACESGKHASILSSDSVWLNILRHSLAEITTKQ